jgi:CheY-like chemotaxis protein
VSATRKRIGEILVEGGLITEKTLTRALERSRRQKKKLGFTLAEIEVITEEELANALANQYGCKVISDFARFRFSPDLLQLVPAEFAIEHLVFPLKIENSRVAMAMADPTETRLVVNLASNNGLTIIPFIATRRDILAAIGRHYLGKEQLEDNSATTVLVVEDNKLIYTMLKNVLANEGYRVVVAMDGMEAYRMAMKELPQVVITDKEMPKMDGYALLDALRNQHETRNIPVLLLTSHTDGAEEARAFEKGFYDFMPKPVREITLITRVKRALQAYERGWTQGN